mgnify:CR=1 FL=1
MNNPRLIIGIIGGFFILATGISALIGFWAGASGESESISMMLLAGWAGVSLGVVGNIANRLENRTRPKNSRRYWTLTVFLLPLSGLIVGLVSGYWSEA